MDKKKKAGIRFDNELYINFIYNPDNDTVEIYRNGELIHSGEGGVTPEELAEILKAYALKSEIPDVSNLATKAELQAVEAEIPDVSSLATKTELQAVEAEIPDISSLATKTELQAVEAEIPDVSNLATKTELQAVEAEIPDVSNLATKTELQAVEAEIPDISNLATKTELQAVEAKIPVIKRGQTSAISIAPTSYTDEIVTFDEPFDVVPTVQGTISSNSTGAGSGDLMCSIFNVSKTGFTIRMFNSGSSNRLPAVQWLALAI